MFVGANCVRPLMIDNENVVIYTKNAQNRNIFWRPQVAPTVRYDGLCIKQTDKLKFEPKERKVEKSSFPSFLYEKNVI